MVLIGTIKGNGSGVDTIIIIIVIIIIVIFIVIVTTFIITILSISMEGDQAGDEVGVRGVEAVGQ